MLLLALPTCIAVGKTGLTLLNPDSAHWPHLIGVVLPGVVGRTLLLGCMVLFGCAVLGTGFAWLTARYRFPGHGWLHAALLLPLAMPGYVLGFVVIAGLDYAGPVQTGWRALTGNSASLWSIRSLGGAALVLTLTLYPYVYLIARNAFTSIGASTIEVAGSLGEHRVFRRLALPMARPWIAGGLLLVAMEVLADFGTVALFNVSTFTTAIYKSWYALFALDAALQLASVLVIVALALMACHRRIQGRGRLDQDTGRPMVPITLQGSMAWLTSGGLSLFVLLVVGLPLGTLLHWSITHISAELDPRYWRWLGHSLFLALSSAALLVGGALILAWLERGHPGRISGWLSRLATLGYALPGTLLAVSLFASLAALEQWLARWIAPGWVTQSLTVLFLGYWARFMAVAHTPVAQQFARITPSLDEVSRSLGVRGLRLVRQVHAPLISGALASAAALVTIDVIKEMPITLMTRPSGWDTLATRIFELTAEGEYHRAALPALTIVLAGLIPVALLLRIGRTASPKTELANAA